jgi:hypothetical protein
MMEIERQRIGNKVVISAKNVCRLQGATGALAIIIADNESGMIDEALR